MRPRRSSLATAITVAALRALPGLAPGSAEAQGGPAQEGALFLLLPIGARTVGTGQAAVAGRPGSEAAWWNPSALARLEKREVALHHGQSIFGTSDAVSVVVPSSLLGTLAVSAHLLDYGPQPNTPDEPGGPSLGTTYPRNIAVAASYATPVGSRLSAGVSYKVVQFRIDCTGVCVLPASSASTSALDVGAQYDFNGMVPLTVGAALRNVGLRLQVNDRDQADPLPTRLQIGLLYRVTTVGATIPGAELSLMGDVIDEVDFEQPGARVGADVAIRKRVHLRAGYTYEPLGGSSPSVGVGITSGRLVIDLARIVSGLSADAGEPPTHLSLRYLF